MPVHGPNKGAATCSGDTKNLREHDLPINEFDVSCVDCHQGKNRNIYSRKLPGLAVARTTTHQNKISYQLLCIYMLNRH